MSKKRILKLTLILFLCAISGFLNPNTIYSQDIQTDYDVVEAISAFEETVDLDEWYEWFDGLTPEQQEIVNYRPQGFRERQSKIYGLDEDIDIILGPTDSYESTEPILTPLPPSTFAANNYCSVALKSTTANSITVNISFYDTNDYYNKISLWNPATNSWEDKYGRLVGLLQATSGTYTFTNLPEGTYRVFVSTYDHANKCWRDEMITVTLTVGNYCDVTLTRATSSTITVNIKFHDTEEYYNKISLWNPVTNKWDDKYGRLVGLSQAKNGTYTFDNLRTGLAYRVFVSTYDRTNKCWRDKTITVTTTGSALLPLSGYELHYNPTFWNSSSKIEYANCYTYALNFTTSLKGGANPGSFADLPLSLSKSGLSKGIEEDLPKIPSVWWYEISEASTATGGYKVGMCIDPGRDYHFYRQNNDGYWSHKRGTTQVIDVDASGSRITNPKTCDRNYIFLNYSEWCGFYSYKP